MWRQWTGFERLPKIVTLPIPERRWLTAAALFLALCRPAESVQSGLLWGHVLDADGRAVAGARVALWTESGVRAGEAVSDEKGWYGLVGLPPGAYRIGVEGTGSALEKRGTIWIEPDGRAYRKLFVGPKAEPARQVDEGRDSAFPTARTVISRGQMDALPTVHSVWSLLENQDFSATVDRIDVGGLWGTFPALFSARGATSWTQNVYLLDGFDVTDPFRTGLPLFIPDVFSLGFAVLDNAALSPRTAGPGGVYHLIPREGTPHFHGGVSAFYLDKALTTSNITPALVAEGLGETNRLNRLMDLNLTLSGPLGDEGWRFFTSWTNQSANRDMAEFEPEDRSGLGSGLLRLSRGDERGTFRFLWTGQVASHPTSGAGRRVPPEATFDERNVHNVFLVSRESKPRPRGSSRWGFSLARADLKRGLQAEGTDGPPGIDLLTGIPKTAAPGEATGARTRLTALFEGRAVRPHLGPTDHFLRYGFELRSSFSRSRLTAKDNLLVRYFEGAPAEVVRYESPFRHAESSAEISIFAEDMIALPGGFSLTLGLHAAGAAGWSRAASIKWFDVSPRLRIDLPLSRKRASAFRVAAARYYGALPLNYLTWGNPDAPGGLVYRWNDDGDGRFQAEEQGPLLRREGPRFGGIDPDILRPRTDEFLIAFVGDLGRGWFLSAAGYLREAGDLVETVNTGVGASDYVPMSVFDPGDDRIVGTPDDLTLTVFSQKPETLGRDYYLLSNPGGMSRRSTYKGFDLVAWKRPTDRTVFFLALTATEAYQTTSPGNTAWENDDGVVGLLYDNPNAEIHARGRPRFDRAYTARLGVSLALPFGFGAGAVAKYYDGQPFARKIVVDGPPQGPFAVLAFPRGVARYEFNMTVDLRLEKRIRLGRAGTLRFLADVFNLFNQHLATEESPWTNDNFPLRFATEIQPPRVARLGLTYSF
ncbi:MAG: hypothetical protein FJY82_03665 [Candidatus Aminicenantes bacterium]|nr:hypothetical protein [Candidatus Aminicenantes bacterium]